MTETQNPIFIPESYEDVKKRYREVYNSLKIGDDHIRVIEYYNLKKKIYRVNIWGICGELEKSGDHWVAIDKKIDFKKGEELKEKIKDFYPGNIEVLVF